MTFVFYLSSWIQSLSSETALTVLSGRDGLNTSTDANDRSLWSIISGCFATIFACTWIAVHSNIPAPTDSAIAILLRRLAIMANLLIVPEFVIMWATRQFLASLEIFERHKGAFMIRLCLRVPFYNTLLCWQLEDGRKPTPSLQ